MNRPTFLMAEVEPPEGLSARKLVLETGKFNVITAYTGQEAVRMFAKFPTVDAVILHTSLSDLPCDEVANKIREIRNDVTIVVLTAAHGHHCEGVEYHVNSHEPQELLNLLQDVFGDPRTNAA